MSTERHVNVDMGYGPAENWQRAKVIRSEMTNQLFAQGQKETLLVELPGGERTWVDYWTEEETQK